MSSSSPPNESKKSSEEDAAATEPRTSASGASGKPRTSLKRPHADEEGEANGGEADNIYSLEEIIEADRQDEEMVGAVLGASDVVNCSYEQGYVYRQALYGCATCLSEMKKRAKEEGKELTSDDELLHGICLACSYKCHANHELYELYTKRHFRCDCGNYKFQGIEFVCKLKPEKEPTNPENKYNHNFEGLYCTCNKPYPDLSTSNGGTGNAETTTTTTTAEATDASHSNEEEEEDEDEDNMEMYQCCVCEDWYHLAHLPGNESFPDEEIDDVVCHLCMDKNRFLSYYQGDVPQKLDNKMTEAEVDVEGVQEADKPITSVVSASSSTTSCLLELAKKHGLVDEAAAAAVAKACCFAKEWRGRLCRCASCLKLYEEHGVEFLLDKTDIISYYEKKGKEEMVELENKVYNDQLNQMNRISQIEFLHNLNEFKTELTDFLNEFARNGEVCKRENVMKFFEDLNERKRRKLETGGGGNGGAYDYYCK